MATIMCSQCGQSSDVEEVETTSGFVWRHCNSCGHFWVLDPELDAFSLIVSNRIADAMPIQRPRPPQGAVRALRFSVRLALRYRVAGEFDWRPGITGNVSRSGVLFRTDRPAEPQTLVEMILELPTGWAGEPASLVQCQGEIVRAMEPETPDMQPAIAAAVGTYRLAAS